MRVVSFSGQGAADQGEGAQSSAAVRTHRGGALEAAGGAEAERGDPQSCSRREEAAAARGGEGQLIENLPVHCDNTCSIRTYTLYTIHYIGTNLVLDCAVLCKKSIQLVCVEFRSDWKP